MPVTMEREQVEIRLGEIGDAAQKARAELDRLIGQIEALRASLDSVSAVSNLPVPPPPPPEPEPDPAPPAPVVSLAPDPAPAPAAVESDGDSAARLVAMKMAIDGSSREEIEAELNSKFGAAERSALLDDVLSRAGR